LIDFGVAFGNPTIKLTEKRKKKKEEIAMKQELRCTSTYGESAQTCRQSNQRAAYLGDSHGAGESNSALMFE